MSGNVFVCDSEAGIFCSDCIPDDLDISDEDVQTWEEHSGGWISPVICQVCKLSIPVYVDGEGEDDGPRS